MKKLIIKPMILIFLCLSVSLISFTTASINEDFFDDDAVLGDPNAPVSIIEWGDYECPFCKRFYQNTFSQIDEEYIQTGKVKFVYRDFPLSFHPQAQKAAEAAECAGEQDAYFKMHEKLYTSGVEGGVTTFKQYAIELGLNKNEFNTCLDSGVMADEVKNDFEEGQAAGIQGTPGFIINGEMVSGALPFSNFKQVIDKKLSGDNSIPNETQDDVIIPTCDNGCYSGTSCIPLGQRLDINDKNMYCSLNSKFLEQKKISESCQNNYECFSNQCNSGLCVDLQKQLEENNNLLQKIISWFGNLI